MKAFFEPQVNIQTGIIITPGIGYGEYGEGYVRIALTVVEEKRLEEAIERLKDLKLQ